MDAGDLVAGRYRLVSQVGRGAMGIVWRARDERADRVVAVKQLLLDTSPTGSSADTSANVEADAARRRAIREGRIAGRLRHPHAIAVYDVVEHNGNPCLIMEYLRSESLSAVLGSRGVLPAEEVAGLGSQVAAALAEAHAVGIVHRDIKPDNVLIAADGTAKITDFGVSRAAGDGGTVSGTVTGTGILAGTPAYLAPEVAAGREADFRSDVFSFGATLYAALEGAPPFGLDANPIALLHRVAHGQIAPPQRSGPLTGLLLSLLRRDPTERPTMRQAHEALAAAAARQPVPQFRPRTPTLVLPTRRLPRRGVIAGMSAAGLIAAGVVIGILISGNRTTSGNTAATPPTTPPPTTATRDDPTCQARYEITNSWPDGYEARVTVHNDGDRTLTGWVVSWTLPGDHKINNLWNGVLSQDGASVTVTNAGWNVTVPAGGSTTFGLVAGAPQADRTPPAVRCQSE